MHLHIGCSHFFISAIVGSSHVFDPWAEKSFQNIFSVTLVVEQSDKGARRFPRLLVEANESSRSNRCLQAFIVAIEAARSPSKQYSLKRPAYAADPRSLAAISIAGIRAITAWFGALCMFAGLWLLWGCIDILSIKSPTNQTNSTCVLRRGADHASGFRGTLSERV
jgi:hypothetical protein